MWNWYGIAVAASITLLIVAFRLGATLVDILVGVSTGLLATTAMIFVVQKVIDDITEAQRAPATLIALSKCLTIYHCFKYTWAEMGRSKNLPDIPWDSRDYFILLQRDINLQETMRKAFIHNIFLGDMRQITWESYLDITRAFVKKEIDDVINNHALFTDPEIIALLSVIKTDTFCGIFFKNFYKGKHQFGVSGWDSDGLYRVLQRDIHNFERLVQKIEDVYNHIKHSRKEAIWRRLRYGATQPSGEW